VDQADVVSEETSSIHEAVKLFEEVVADSSVDATIERCYVPMRVRNIHL
jgi:hypothetical protein